MIEFRNPAYADETGDVIACEVFAGGRWRPFAARRDDPNPRGRALFARIAAGAVAAYVAPPEPPAPDLEDVADRLAADLDRQGTLLWALGVEVFDLARSQTPGLTPEQFRRRIRNRIRGAI